MMLKQEVIMIEDIKKLELSGFEFNTNTVVCSFMHSVIYLFILFS